MAHALSVPRPDSSGRALAHARQASLGVDCLPGRSGRRRVRVVIPRDNIFEDLKALPPDRLEMAANYIGLK